MSSLFPVPFFSSHCIAIAYLIYKKCIFTGHGYTQTYTQQGFHVGLFGKKCDM